MLVENSAARLGARAFARTWLRFGEAGGTARAPGEFAASMIVISELSRSEKVAA